MTPKEFYENVKQLRLAQREYFATRSTKALAQSKTLEKVIDDEIERVERLLTEKVPVQGKLNL